MRAQQDIRIRLTSEDVMAFTAPVGVDVVHRETGELIETVTVLRYAGRYRNGSVEAFAIKDADGKFRVRGARALGLTDDSSFFAFRVAAQPISAA